MATSEPAVRLTDGFLEEVVKASGVDIRACYQCQKCSAGCPVASAMDILPNQVIRQIQYGRREKERIPPTINHQVPDPAIALDVVPNAARDARGSLSTAMSQAAENLSPETRAAWQQGNQRYSLGSVLRDYARPQGSQLPGAVIEGAAQSVGGRFLGRAAGGAVSNYGPAMRARSLQVLIPILRTMGGAAARFAPVLEQAGARGGQTALAGMHYVLSQTNPEYRAAIEQARAQQEEQEQ